jgi:hypothetical protein
MPRLVFLALVVIAIAVGALILPVSPVISGTFSIKRVGYDALQVENLGSAYSKVPITETYALYETEGSVTLPVRPAKAGTYTLTIEVSYGTFDQFNAGTLKPILSRTIEQIAEGTYGFEISFFYVQETPGIPYIVTVRASGAGLQEGSVSFIVTP